MNFKKYKILYSVLIGLFCTNIAYCYDYEPLKNQLISNFPDTFQGQKIPPRTKNFGMAIINQIITDFEEINFIPEKAQWSSINNYIQYDSNSSKQIGTTCWLVYKTADDKIIGTYKMNSENPFNNRLLHTSYKFSGGSYTIKQKIHRDLFSHVICKKPAPKDIQRFK